MLFCVVGPPQPSAFPHKNQSLKADECRKHFPLVVILEAGSKEDNTPNSPDMQGL